MTIPKSLITVVIFLLAHTTAIWPPAYKINLSHEETFVISEVLNSDDGDDIYDSEDEMIKEADLKSFNLNQDSGKYHGLHQLTLRRNQENFKADNKHYNTKKLKKQREANYEMDDVESWETGFADGNIKSEYNENENETVKNVSKHMVRQVSATFNKSENKDTNYDYISLKKEYEDNIKKIKGSNETLNYTEIKEEESFQDAVKAIAGKSKKQRNCTAEERKGIGLAAAECFWVDLTKSSTTKKDRSQIFHRIGKIILIWLLVYLLVAIPCWCQKGWCCCCFQCKFCRPHERIDIAKKYLMDNPLGVYHRPDDEKITYQPTPYERYAQKRLEKALMKL